MNGRKADLRRRRVAAAALFQSSHSSIALDPQPQIDQKGGEELDNSAKWQFRQSRNSSCEPIIAGGFGGVSLASGKGSGS